MSQRMINDTFWTDPYIEDLDPSEKLVYLYLLTNPICNIAGAYEIKMKRIAYETGFDKEMIDKILTRFMRDWKILRVDDWILIINFSKNQSYNPNVLKGMQRIIDELPEKVKALKGFESLPYFTLLNLTLPNLTKPSEEKPLEVSDIEIFPKEKTSKEIENEETANMLALLRKIVGLDKFKDYKEWTEAWNCLKIFKKIWEQEFISRITTILADDFKRKNCNKLEFLRKEIESFIHSPIVPERPKRTQPTF